MSNLLAKPPASPSSRWLSNDEGDGSIAAQKSSDLDREDSKTGTNMSKTTASQQDASIHYPVDENLFYSAPSETLEDKLARSNIEDEPEAEACEEPAPEELLPPPDFKPLFAVIDDLETGEHIHPTVHYIFSDDDPEILTSAALDAIDRQQDDQDKDTDEERHVIVDMAADGKTVASVSSLSPHWQAINATVASAPSWGDDARDADRGLMLKLSGQEAQISMSKKKNKSRQTAEGIDGLVKSFSDRLDSLDDVVGQRQPIPDDFAMAEQDQG